MNMHDDDFQDNKMDNFDYRKQHEDIACSEYDQEDGCNCFRCYKLDLLSSADLSISEYMEVEPLVDSDSEKAFELLYTALWQAVADNQFNELIAALSKFRSKLAKLQPKLLQASNKIFLKSTPLFSPVAIAESANLGRVANTYLMKVDVIQRAAKALFEHMPKEDILDIDDAVFLLTPKVFWPSESIAILKKEPEDGTSESFHKGVRTLTELDPMLILHLKKLIKGTKGSAELLSAVENIHAVIDEVIAERDQDTMSEKEATDEASDEV